MNIFPLMQVLFNMGLLLWGYSMFIVQQKMVLGRIGRKEMNII